MTTLASAIPTTMPKGKPPGWIAGNLLEYRRDPLAFMMSNAREYGDVVQILFGKYVGYQINHPDDVQQVLVKQTHKLHKARIYKQFLSEYLGNGLLISDGDFWKRQRHLAQPAFHTKRIQSYASVMSEYTERMLATWHDGETRDIAHEMMTLTLFIVSKTLFDADVSGESSEVAQALEVMLHSISDTSRTIVRLPDWVPTPARRRKQWSIDTLHRITKDIIAERRVSGEDKGDLLSMLITAETDTGERMTDEQVRDEALTLVLAGHETTANAMAWTFYLLSQHPDIEQRLYEEVSSVLGGRMPTLADLAALPYTEQVMKEGMRLYPPAWSFARTVKEPFELENYTLPVNSTLIVLPYVIHRDARWFPDPERFDPERFSPEREASIPKYAYLPFGGGPRVCIGNAFAMMEARLILAGVVQRYRLVLAASGPVVPEPLITLRPKGGMPMTLVAR